MHHRAEEPTVSTVLTRPTVGALSPVPAVPGPIAAGPSPTQLARTDLLAMASSMIPFGIALGVTVSSLRVGHGASVAGGVLMYAGAAQLSATTMLSHGAAFVAVVLSAVIVNSRLLLYGAALEPAFRGQPWWFRWLGIHFIIDGSFVAAMGRPALMADRAGFRRYWLHFGLLLLGIWTSSVAVGVLLGPVLPSLPHIGLIGLALFVSMLMPRLTSHPAVAAAAVAALVGPLTTLLVPSLGIIAGACAGVAAGTFTAGRQA
jgi:predicted branched-subunit amino acid permease